ncbi:tubulin-specific chaperone c, putative [Talaromyces stipitatus ATCC 10500]|uniref:Tubulin-specific chaperone c, putative n=1 Tax=Talaromyces stipitatus (strain ATCC 10500 / CBS 375.48 / QM 6759 / NRRL 1006) TaxID=441959 RepID=B8MTJ5_TALSN|nr:tubulin-specific chaperone c, putative [Talaromyces stipitatus ATCC 10500]EED12400.1 tubulin-specific chaperone c, putative [Talaromyces stipitatus ATCC 10500]
MADIARLTENLPPETKEEIAKNDLPLKDRFFRYFQQEITALQEQMARLADTSIVAGERSDATDHCLAGIARLSNEVKDASSYIPTYDQRIYAEAIKALQDKLSETRAAVQPRAKFSFKTKKNPSAISLSDAAEIAAQGRRIIPGYLSPEVSSQDSSRNPTPLYSSTPVNEVETLQLRPEIAPTSSPAILDEGKDTSALEKKSNNIRRPTFSNASSVSVDQHYGLHIMLPASASSASVPASITSLRHCVVDMSIPTTDGKPYASLTVNGVKESLIICGQVDGPAHVTGVEHSTIVLSCRQFRMHNCTDVDVYLSCTSNPIIEDCTRIRFSRIPKTYVCPPPFPPPPKYSQSD